jgi:iron(III) transport system ATP-binding protein
MGTIEIKSLTKTYGHNRVVDKLCLSIEDGQFVTLLGPSGCGKTTTLRMLAGFITPDEGTITVDGRLLSSPSHVVPPENRGMGMVFQNYALWPHKSVYQNVAYGLRMQRPKPGRDEIRARVAAILETVGLRGYEDRFPGQLSGGQQQRVALARSLVTEPSILLLDEPLSNLDAKLRDKMRDEVQEIQRRTNITFVYVTHDQTEAMSMSDRIAVMQSGVLEQYAPPRQVYFRPANVAVADFMGLINLIPARVESFDESEATAGVELGFGVRLRVPTADGYLPSPGEGVTVAVRPESIAIRQSNVPNQGPVAEVSRVMMLGHLCYYVLSVGGIELRVQTDNLVDLRPGDRVTLDIDPRHASVFPASTATEPLVEEPLVEKELVR